MDKQVAKAGREPIAVRDQDIFTSLRREMDDLFTSFFRDPSRKTALGEAISPAMDVKEDDKAITVTAELPGMAEDEVHVTVRNGMLEISGEKKREEKRDDENYHVWERSYGSFRRAFGLPERADPDAISADYDKGVLTVRIAKRAQEKQKARKIEVARKG